MIIAPLLAELIGTAILIVLGNGVVANVLLQQTKGHGSGWIVIASRLGNGRVRGGVLRVEV